MSVTISLVPLVVVMASTVSLSALQGMVEAVSQSNYANDWNAPAPIISLPTIFSDDELLYQTLTEHGLKVAKLSALRMTTQIQETRLIYSRNNTSDPFTLNIEGKIDLNVLKQELGHLDKEYGMNVQSYTYNRLVSQLSENDMAIADETVLADDTIVITLDVN